MKISKLRICNFKLFRDITIKMNSGINIFVGENDSGKTTILEAISMVLTGRLSGGSIANRLNLDWFNIDVRNEYRTSVSSGCPLDLPCIEIEAFFSPSREDEVQIKRLRGTNNSFHEDSEGVKIEISFDSQYSETYRQLLSEGEIKDIPIEYYHVIYRSFANPDHYLQTTAKRVAFIDTTKKDYGPVLNRFISGSINEYLTDIDVTNLRHAYRSNRHEFTENQAIKSLNKKLQESHSFDGKTISLNLRETEIDEWKDDISVSLDSIPLDYSGFGTQNMFKSELFLQQNAEVDILIIEEPENNLSFANMSILVSKISANKEVQNYCQEYGTSISSVEFISSALKSRILSRCSDNGLKFCNNNYLAYFIAYEICISEDKEALENCLKCSCFGINANILIFVSYITNKLSLIEYLLNTANQLIISGKEFAFGMDELSYLSGYKSEALDSLLPPTEEDIEKDHQASIEKDKNELESANIDVISIYDYDEEELTKIENQIIRSISLMSLIARCLPIFEHRLKKTEKERLVETLYRLPNTIFFIWADEVEKHYSELISLISNLESNEFTRHKLSIEEASQLLGWNSISLLLELYYLVANYAYRENTYEYLTDMAQSTFPFENETHYIEYLIILGQAKRIGQFITIGKQLKDSTKHPMAQLALIRTVQHIMLKGAVNRKQLDQLKSIFFPGVRAKDVLISRKAEERKEPNDHK